MFLEAERRRDAKEEDVIHVSDASEHTTDEMCPESWSGFSPGKSPETHSPDSVGQPPSQYSKVIWVKCPRSWGPGLFS